MYQHYKVRTRGKRDQRTEFTERADEAAEKFCEEISKEMKIGDETYPYRGMIEVEDEDGKIATFDVSSWMVPEFYAGDPIEERASHRQ
jgi:hypothetical protein